MTNLIFLFFFLPVVFLFYYISNAKMKKVCLIIASIIFVFIQDLYLPVLYFVLSLLAFIIGSILIKIKNKTFGNIAFAFFSILYASVLGFFHFGNKLNLNIIPENIIFPIGMSFFILKCIFYFNDCKNKDIVLKSNFFDFLLYAFYFPAFILGPVLSFDYFMALLKKTDFRLCNVGKGFYMFIAGFSLKIIIADNLFKMVNSVFSLNTSSISCIMIWYTAIAFFFYIYFLFASYSRMAEGMSLIFGIKIPKNNYPYFMCDTFSDFSKKWNVSVSRIIDKSFLKINISEVSDAFISILVWSVTGLWFGFNLRTLCFGLVLGIILTFENIFGLNKVKKENYFRRIFVFTLLFVLSVLLMPVDFDLFIQYAKALICRGFPLWNGISSSIIQEYLILFIISIISALNISKNYAYSRKKVNAIESVIESTFFILRIAVFVLSVCILIFNGGNSSVQLPL